MPCLQPLRCTGLGLLASLLVAQAPGPARSERELRAFYLQSCARCHGEDGSARTPEGRKLKGRDFTAERGLGGASDEALVKSIRRGIFYGLAMPSFKQDLSEGEALLLVREVLRKVRRGQPIHVPGEPGEPARPSAGSASAPR